MKYQISRRRFLRRSAMLGGLTLISRKFQGDAIYALPASEFDFPIVDFHAHPFEDGFSLEKAIELGKQRGVKLGVLEHGGRGEKLLDDATLKRHIDLLAPLPVYKGIQAEGLDWPKCFSKEQVAKLDYVLSDALTLPEPDGKKVHIWTTEVKITDKQDFMERYVAFNVQVMAEEPIDIFANPTFLPDAILAEYDTLWTKPRMNKVIEAATKYHVAIEINSRYNIPSLTFLRMAKEAGAEFSFGTNNRGEQIAKLDYSLKMAKELGLKRENMFTPAPAGRKPILARKFAA